MKLLDPVLDLLKETEERDLYTYLAFYAGGALLLFLIFVYFHYSSVQWYKKEFTKLDTLRVETKKVLRSAKLVKAQQAEVEELLAQDKDFRIGQAYPTLIKGARLTNKVVNQSTPTTGETFKGKTEVLITSRLRGLSMKEVTDLLLAVAEVPQLYTKEITLRKMSGRPTLEVDITVATLESSTLE